MRSGCASIDWRQATFTKSRPGLLTAAQIKLRVEVETNTLDLERVERELIRRGRAILSDMNRISF
jgi:hypothetical protein